MMHAELSFIDECIYALGPLDEPPVTPARVHGVTIRHYTADFVIHYCASIDGKSDPLKSFLIYADWLEEQGASGENLWLYALRNAILETGCQRTMWRETLRCRAKVVIGEWRYTIIMRGADYRGSPTCSRKKPYERHSWYGTSTVTVLDQPTNHWAGLATYPEGDFQSIGIDLADDGEHDTTVTSEQEEARGS